jgi:hypothetical protein
MPSTYKLIQEAGYLRIVVSSSITLPGFLQAYKDVADTDGMSAQPRLWILPESVSGFSFEELSDLASVGASLRVAGKAAFVAPSDFIFGVARQSTQLRPDNPDRFAVFQTEAEALAWLDVEKT